MIEPFRWLVEFLALCLVLIWLARLTRRRSVLILTVATFVLRLAVGEALFVISALGLPMLRSQQLPGGFWSFGYDGYLYHNRALIALDHASSSLIPLKPLLLASPSALGFQTGAEFTTSTRFLAMLYAVFGSSPSVGLTLVAAAAAATAPLIYLAGRGAELSHHKCLALALLLAAWPSSFIWSAGILKDPFEWLGALAISAGIIWLLRSYRPNSRRVLGIGVGAVIGGELLLVSSRGYAATAWVIAILLGIVAFVLKSHHSPARKLQIGGTIITLVIIAGLRAPILAEFSRLVVGAVSDLAASIRLTPADSASEFDPSISESNRQNILVLCQYPGLPRGLIDSDGNGYVATTISEFRGANVKCPSLRVASSVPAPATEQAQCGPLESLLKARRGFMAEGGASQVDGNVRLSSCWSVLAYVPRAAELTFLWPPPTRWSQFGTYAGGLRYVVSIEAVLLWLLMPGLVAGLVRSFRHPGDGKFVIAVYALILGLALGLVVTNFGSLLRIRLTAVFPATILAIDGWSFLVESSRRWLPLQSSARSDSGRSLPTEEAERLSSTPT